MEQYIKKSALVAEIERKINEINLDIIEDWRYRLQREHDIEVMKNILSLINTLEVKEVDLKKEIDFYIESSLTGTNPIYTKGTVSCIIEKTAKHFFELGIKTAHQ